jgi:NAD(P)-dependent dehydrogenase (short-subunit alcohol dehydrogenase family)
MQDLEGKVAVVTGAASGIGRAMAERFAQEGMKVVLSDIEETALTATVQALKQQERDVIGVVTDVARPEAVDDLARRTLDAFGKVHVVCNNAGVFLGMKPMWESTLKDWNWIMGVNVWGVINGVRSFVPIMLQQDEPGHIVNTASQAGLVTGNSIYSITKHSVVSLSEGLSSQLKQQDAKVGVSVLCPLFVDTRIMEAERNRPAELQNPDGSPANTMQMRDVTPAAEEAERVLQAVLNDTFYIFPYLDRVDDNVRYRFDNIINRKNPEPRPMR